MFDNVRYPDFVDIELELRDMKKRLEDMAESCFPVHEDQICNVEVLTALKDHPYAANFCKQAYNLSMFYFRFSDNIDGLLSITMQAKDFYASENQQRLRATEVWHGLPDADDECEGYILVGGDGTHG